MSYLAKKYIGDDQVDDVKLLLNNMGMLRAKTANGLSVVNVLRVTNADLVELQQLVEVNAALPMPWKPKHVATLEYIENYVKGKTDAKDALNVMSDVNVPLAGNTPLVIDGFTVLDGWRVGLPDQTTAADRGYYKMVDAGATYTLVRTSDFDQVDDASGMEVTSGSWTKVIAGTSYGGWELLLSTADPIVVGTTALTFVKYPSSLSFVAGDMLAKSGNTLSVDLSATGALESDNPGNNAGKLKIRADQASLEKDKTTRIDSGTNALVAPKSKHFTTNLTATDISNGYVDLPDVAQDSSCIVTAEGAPPQFLGADFTVNYTGGLNGKTRITFAGQLAIALAASDDIYVDYRAY